MGVFLAMRLVGFKERLGLKVRKALKGRLRVFPAGQRGRRRGARVAPCFKAPGPPAPLPARDQRGPAPCPPPRSYRGEAARQSKAIWALEKERERYTADAVEQEARHQQASLAARGGRRADRCRQLQGSGFRVLGSAL